MRQMYLEFEWMFLQYSCLDVPLIWVAVVAQQWSSRLIIRKSWVQILPSAEFFSSSIFSCFPSPVECPYLGPLKRCACNCVL